MAGCPPGSPASLGRLPGTGRPPGPGRPLRPLAVGAGWTALLAPAPRLAGRPAPAAGYSAWLSASATASLKPVSVVDAPATTSICERSCFSTTCSQ